MFDGNGLATLLAAGMVTIFAAFFFIPPAVLVGVAWLIAPRFGFDVNLLVWFLVALALWVPTCILWIKLS